MNDLTREMLACLTDVIAEVAENQRLMRQFIDDPFSRNTRRIAVLREQNESLIRVTEALCSVLRGTAPDVEQSDDLSCVSTTPEAKAEAIARRIITENRRANKRECDAALMVTLADEIKPLRQIRLPVLITTAVLVVTVALILGIEAGRVS